MIVINDSNKNVLRELYLILHGKYTERFGFTHGQTDYLYKMWHCISYISAILDYQAPGIAFAKGQILNLTAVIPVMVTIIADV